MDGRLKKPIIAIALIMTVVVGGYLFQSLNKSALIKKIQRYETRHATSDISPVVKNDIVEGMPIEDAIQYFSSMGFSIHTSWKDKSVQVAHFQSPLFWPFPYAIKSYSFVLKEENGRLLHYNGTVKVEGP